MDQASNEHFASRLYPTTILFLQTKIPGRFIVFISDTTHLPFCNVQKRLVCLYDPKSFISGMLLLGTPKLGLVDWAKHGSMDHSDSEKGNLLPPHRLLLSINSKGSFICTIPQTGALAGTRNSSMGPPHEGSIRRPITPWANALPLSYVPLQQTFSAAVNRHWAARWTLTNQNTMFQQQYD